MSMGPQIDRTPGFRARLDRVRALAAGPCERPLRPLQIGVTGAMFGVALAGPACLLLRHVLMGEAVRLAWDLAGVGLALLLAAGLAVQVERIRPSEALWIGAEVALAVAIPLAFTLVTIG
jgi:hypothetical protein